MPSISKYLAWLEILVMAILIAGVGCMDKTTLEKEDRDLLKDINAFNDKVGKQGWHLENRQFAEEVMRGIILVRSSFRNVDMPNIDMSNCDVSGSEFTTVDFGSSNLSDSKFTKTRFASCIFTYSKLERSEFVDCDFTDCKVEDAQMEKAVFRDCRFENHEDNSSSMESVTLQNCRFEKSDLNNSSFYYSRFDSVEFHGGHLKQANFANTQIQGITFHGVKLDYCSFNECTAQGLTIEECTGKRVSFVQADITGLRVIGCNGLNSLNLINSDCRDLLLDNCGLLSEPRFQNSRLENLSVHDCHLEFVFWEGAEFQGRSVISDSKIAGLNLIQAKVNNLTFKNVSFFDYLAISGARFEGLVLEKVTFANDLAIQADDVRYTDSDRFPD